MKWDGPDHVVKAIEDMAAINNDIIEQFVVFMKLSDDEKNFKKFERFLSIENKGFIEKHLFEALHSENNISVANIIEEIKREAESKKASEEVQVLSEELSKLNLNIEFYIDNDGEKEKHKIYQKDREFFVESNPTPLKTIIANCRWEGRTIGTSDIAQLISEQAKAQSALDNIAGKKSSGITGARTKPNMKAFQAALQRIAGILSGVGNAAIKPVLIKKTDLSNSTNFGLNSEPTEGKQVIARPLTLSSGTAGSKPKDGRLMKSIRRAAGLQSKSYVQMHLLNDLVFGPGELWNLTPGPKKSNSIMESLVEDPLKRVIIDKGLTINFEVVVTYQNDPMSATQKQIDQNPNDYRFTFITFTATQLECDPKTSMWVKATAQDKDVLAINNKKVNWDYGSLNPLVAKPRILDAATSVADLVNAKIQPAAAARIHAYVQANPGVVFYGPNKQQSLALAVKKWDLQKTIPNISSWKATSVLWT